MRDSYRVLGRDFFDRPAEDVAAELLGALLVSEQGGLCVGRIVEVEAYTGPEDPASHAWERIGRTPRNDPMFGPPGIAYIYRSFGIHWCLNVVAGAEGFPAAVLIRALEPLDGVDLMRRRRNVRRERDLTSGPGRLTQALAIGPQLQRHPMHEPPLYIAEGESVPRRSIGRARRIGISRGTSLRLRFFIRNNSWVSR